MNHTKRRGGRMYGGQWHPGSCACPQCDPEQTKVKAQRARVAAEKASAADAGSNPQTEVKFRFAPARAPASAWREPRTNDTRRLAELLRAGKSFVQAAEIIEAERQQKKGNP